MGGERRSPSVSVVVPVLDEAGMIGPCLEAVLAQDYPLVREVVVADGGSSDGTREIAAGFRKVVLVENPRRSRPAGLNVAISAATGDVIVRVDARTRLAPDYVSRCVAALERSGAAIVGGPMRFACASARDRGIAAAMMSRVGAGPAQFRRLGGEPRYVDTVYLGAYRREVIERLGGYDEDSGGNEDAELAYRAQAAGGVYLDPSIVSTYVVREGLRPLARQFYRYGRNRALTVRQHPGSLSARQLAVPALALGLLSPWRRPVLAIYLSLVLGRTALEASRDPAAAPTLLVALPTMHAAWGAGFARGITARSHGRQAPAAGPS
ncbi:MAG TPA: glycosyltransferase family 2 protein [Acidimicrobiales bacterium]|nr:glycosyltransferase family 2 protein [Acidimicrobiales bacterium]